MKKSIIFIASIIFAICFTACGNSGEKKKPDRNNYKRDKTDRRTVGILKKVDLIILQLPIPTKK